MRNVFYAQSGGVTSVINATACGLIQTARLYPEKIGKVFAGHFGIEGALQEALIDTTLESDETIAQLKHTPGGIFGSCRYKLPAFDKDPTPYERLLEVFKAHDIGYFFYNGGGDSQDTTHKISQLSLKWGYPLTCIGLPKTIDNDLAQTDHSPGFGSVAKYIATSVKEAGLDVASMCHSSTKVFILEVMGRHSGWIAASAALAREFPSDPPHLLLFPEIPFTEYSFLQKVQSSIEKNGYCVVVVSEGLRDREGRSIGDTGLIDAFGHHQLGGVAPVIARLVKEQLGIKYHWCVVDYLQRCARHLASKVDVREAYQLGAAAIERALAGEHEVMLTLSRSLSNPLKSDIQSCPLEKVANIEKILPRNYISLDGYDVTHAALEYLRPLIQGEDYPPYVNGLPQYARLKKVMVPKKLGAWKTETSLAI